LSAGGPATNAAATFAFLGGQASLLTGAGRHPMAAIFRHDLARFDIALQDLAAATGDPPPLSSIFVIGNTGARTIVSASRALLSLDYDAFRPEALEGSAFLLVDGHYMPLAIAAASAARQRGMRVILDGGSWKEGMMDLLPLVDTAICPADFRAPGHESEDAVAAFLRGCGIAQVAITRGPSAIRFWTDSAAG
jgi:sugar/nucleoside kinase (ribokinase family)